MADATPESTFDAVKYVTGRIRIVWAVLGALAIPVAWGGSHLYDLVIWVEQNRAHEEAQDAKDKDTETKFKLVANDRDSENRRSDERINIVLGQLDSIREVLIELTPPRKRSRLRRGFAVQRTKERELLLGRSF